MYMLEDITLIEKVLLTVYRVILFLVGYSVIVLTIVAIFRQRKKNKYYMEAFEKEMNR